MVKLYEAIIHRFENGMPKYASLGSVVSTIVLSDLVIQKEWTRQMPSSERASPKKC